MSICLVKKQKSPLMLFAWWGIADTQTTLSAAFGCRREWKGSNSTAAKRKQPPWVAFFLCCTANLDATPKSQ